MRVVLTLIVTILGSNFLPITDRDILNQHWKVKALPESASPQSPGDPLQTNSLCAKSEHIIFSCVLKRTAKIVSLCASPDLDKERGYLQYRFGLPAKVE